MNQLGMYMVTGSRNTATIIIIVLFNFELLYVSVIESCDILGENCNISKPRNSTCLSHGTYLYYGYTDDIEYLLQLEYTAINYIEANVSNHFCRNYLKAALCVTIYPPCNDSGVQKLCYEECDSLLNNGICSSDARYLIQHVNNMSSNAYSNFTIDCFNSLNFLSRFSNANPCQSNSCVSLLDIAEFPTSCTHIEFAGEKSCSPYSLSLNHMIFKYTNDKNFSRLLDVLESTQTLLANSRSRCKLSTGVFLCNLAFIPCNLTTGTPRPLCSRSCSIFRSVCNIEFNTVLIFAEILDIHFSPDCQNTLHHINAVGFGFPNSSSEFEDDCFNLPNLPDGYEPPISSNVEPTNSTDISNTTHTTSTVVITEASNTITLFDSTANNITTSMTDKITRINSSMVAIGEMIEHGSKKSFTMPVILACVFGGLGLCVVSCIIGILLRRQRKKRQNKHHRLMLTVSNPLFDRITTKMKKKNTILKELNERLLTMEILKKQCQGLLLPKCGIKPITELGEGEFGRVYKGTWEQTIDGNTVTKVVAVKTIKDYSSMEVLESFIHESVMMKNFDHPNVLHILGVGLDPDNGLPFIVLPFMANGNLQMYLKSKRSKATSVNQLPEGMKQKSFLDICYQIACGMSYLVEKRFVHRDLAARNCMVGNGLTIKVADFGLAKDVYMTDYYRQQSIEKMPIKWMAPEAMHDRISNEKTDVWSYGVTCWEVYSLGRTPYPTIPNEELLEFIDKGNRLSKPELCSDEMYSLILKCWEVDVENRICFEEIVIELNEEVNKGYVIESLDDNDIEMDDCYTIL